MSADPRQVPPTPGTQSRVSRHRERPYREVADLYASHRAEGSHPYTQDEIEARIVANAADLAAGEMGESGPLEASFLRELVQVFRHRVYRGLPLDEEQREDFVSAVPQAGAQLEAAENEHRRLENRWRELESQRRRLPRPIGGTSFTRPEWLLGCLLAAGTIEVMGSVPALEAAFKLDTPRAWVFAIAISAILILAADQLGNTLASASREARRWAKVIAIGLVLFAVGSGIWAIASLAQSRQTNTAFKALGSREAESGSSGLAAAAGQESVATAKKKLQEAQARRKQGSAKLDIGFFVPLSILIVATSTLLAFRVEGAADWNDLSETILDAQGEMDKGQITVQRARDKQREVLARHTEATFQVAAYLEREHGLLGLWIDRFISEYARFCAAEGKTARELARPEAPTPADLLIDLLYPGRRIGRQEGVTEAEPDLQPEQESDEPPPLPEEPPVDFEAESGPGPESGGPAGDPEPPREPEPAPGTDPEPPRRPAPGRMRSPDGHPAGMPRGSVPPA